MLYYSKDLINLDKNLSIANGNCRNVFLYDGKCIKISLKETLIKRKNELKKKNKFKWFFKPLLKWYDENYNDIRFYKINSNKKDIYNYIPKFYGICKTNLGIGIVVEYMIDKNGDKLPTISEYIKKHGVNEELTEAIKNLWNIMISNNIQIRAPHAENFLVSGGGYR